MRTGTRMSAQRAPGHMNCISLVPPPPQLPDLREPRDRPDEVALGRDLEDVDAGVDEGYPQRLLVLCDHPRESLAEPPVVRVDLELLTRLGVGHGDPADVGDLALPRIAHAHGDDLIAHGQPAEGA